MQQHPDERNNLDAITNITLYCKEQIKYKQLKLYGRELEKSVEVKLDNHFEIMEFYNNSRQIIASITPKIVPGFVGMRNWDYLSYEAHSNKLVVHTNYSDVEHENKEADAYIQMTAIPLPESKKADNTTIRFKTYSTNKNENDFIMDHLEPNKMYAVQYTYGKQSPFAYAESQRFIVQTKSSDGSAAHSPLKLMLDQSPNPPEPPTNTSNNTFEPPSPPKLIMRLDPQFKNYEVGVDVEPFCNPTPNGSHFWLNKDKPSKELKDINVADALCDQVASYPFCDNPDSNSTMEKRKKCSLGSELCYTTSIVVQEKIYSMSKKCIDVPKHYHPPQPSTTTPAATGNSATAFSLNRLCLVAVFFLLLIC
uniref:Vitellogenin n=1 Tax=Ditylenchus dipsaci TaxID=166011 RepID=A0A915CX85_9BILA